MDHPEDHELERLLGRVPPPSAPLGFEHRVLARLRREKETAGWLRIRNWWMELSLGRQGALSASFAAVVILASLAAVSHWEHVQKTDELVSALEVFEQYEQDRESWTELDLYTSQ